MIFTKEEIEKLKRDPFMQFCANMLGTSTEKIIEEAEKEAKSHVEFTARPINETKHSDTELATAKPVEKVKTTEGDEIKEQIKKFFDKMVESGEATVRVEDGRPHYSIKLKDDCKEVCKPEELIEENENTSFSMSKEDLEEFIKDYTKLDETVRKLEHTYGIDLNANADSIYTQYNAIIWNLIDKIFGPDNRDDIADYIFGDSNFDSVEDLYEELV